MAEKLACYDKCPFVQSGLIRPCSTHINKDPGGICETNIRSDQAFSQLGKFSVESDMSTLPWNYARIRINGKTVAIIHNGYINRENISYY
jgi:hypothetical protein